MRTTPSRRGSGRDLPTTVARSLAGAARRVPKTVVVLWLALVVSLSAAGVLSGTVSSDDGGSVGESRQATELRDAAGLAEPARERILLTGATAATVRVAAADLTARLRRAAGTTQVRGPGDARAQLADGGRSALVTTAVRGDPDDAADRLGPIEAAVAATAQAHPGVRVEQSGDASLDKAIDTVVEEDLGKVEVLSLPLTLGILLLAFGAVVAASVPLLLGITAVAGALGAFALCSHVVPADPSATSLVVLIGLAVGVDYSLFALRRFREERAAGVAPIDAVDAIARSVGRATIVAGLTVAVAMAGLLVTGLGMFVSMAIGTIMVVVLAVLGSLTVLPAVITLLGDRVEKGRLPWARRRTGMPVEVGLSGRIARGVTARPVLGLLAAVCLLGALALPAAQLHTAESDSAGLSNELPAIAAQEHIAQTFPGGPSPALLVVDGDRTLPRAGLEKLGAAATRITGVGDADGVRIRRADDGRTAVLAVPAPEAGTQRGRDTADALRADLEPEAAGLPSGTELLVGGDIAEERDFVHRMDVATPIVIGLVLLLSFGLLLVAFRSPLLAIAVIGLDLLSVGATYGVLAGVFQHDWAEGVLGFTSSGAVVSWIPLFTFVILFGISMDYTVLVLERVREARASGLRPRPAAAAGVAATAGAVTSAASVMAVVFALFALMRLPAMQQLGVALATGVVIDATLVRGIALPAVCALVPKRLWTVVEERPSARSGHPRADAAARRPVLAGGSTDAR